MQLNLQLLGAPLARDWWRLPSDLRPQAEALARNTASCCWWTDPSDPQGVCRVCWPRLCRVSPRHRWASGWPWRCACIWRASAPGFEPTKLLGDAARGGHPDLNQMKSRVNQLYDFAMTHHDLQRLNGHTCSVSWWLERVGSRSGSTTI